MTDLNYNYRQYIIKNTQSLQKKNIEHAVNLCCFCDKCAYNTIHNIYPIQNNTIYMTEPSDLEQSYNYQFKQSVLRSRLNP
jgi:hypothetical protein